MIATATRRRAPGRRSGAWIRRELRLAVYLRDGFACVYCLAAAEQGAELTLDHLCPRRRGGRNDPSNLVTACLGCNSRKQDARGRLSAEERRRARNAVRRAVYRELGRELLRRRAP